MELLLFAVFAIIAAMLWNWGYPQFTSYVSGNASLASFQASYAGSTVITAFFLFVLLLIVGFIFSLVGVKAKEGAVSVG